MRSRPLQALANSLRAIGQEDRPATGCNNIDLKDFLKFKDMCEAKAFSGDEIDQQAYANFNNLITDPNKCVLTGSSVLNYRIGRQSEADDIDFFITDTPGNKKIVKSFFDNNFFRDNVFKQYRDDVLLKNVTEKHHGMNFMKGYYENTSFNDAYNLIKLDFKIDTFRFGYSSQRKTGFNLNFIFVQRLTDDERSLLGIQGRLTSSLYDYSFYNRDREFTMSSGNVFSPGRRISESVLTLMEQKFPKAIPLHVIHDSFDFEELKYMYSFELQQVISTFVAAKMILKKYKEDIKTMQTNAEISEESRDIAIKAIDNYITNLGERNKKFSEITSVPNRLTISERILPEHAYERMKDANNWILKGHPTAEVLGGMGETGLIKNIKHIHTAYHNIMQRLPKYQNRGFTIEDPQNFIADLQTFITLHTSYILQNQDINNIAKRASLTMGKRLDTQKIKLLRTTYKQFTELSTNNNIVHTKPKEEINAKSKEEFSL